MVHVNHSLCIFFPCSGVVTTQTTSYKCPCKRWWWGGQQADGLRMMAYISYYRALNIHQYFCLFIPAESAKRSRLAGSPVEIASHSIHFGEQIKAHNCILNSGTFTGWDESGSSFLWGPLFDPSSQAADYSVSNSLTKNSPSALFRGIPLLPWNTLAPAGNGKVPVMNCFLSTF